MPSRQRRLFEGQKNLKRLSRHSFAVAVPASYRADQSGKNGK
jgi:hypothetical protein